MQNLDWVIITKKDAVLKNTKGAMLENTKDAMLENTRAGNWVIYGPSSGFRGGLEILILMTTTVDKVILSV